MKFANLTFAIEERKSEALLIQHNINNIEEQKQKIDTIKINKVENTYANRIARANKNYNEQVKHQNQYISQQLNGMDNSYKAKIDKEKRLYALSDYATGTKALDQQTGTEKQLQEQLAVVGKTYQQRVDAIHSRIDYLKSNKIQMIFYKLSTVIKDHDAKIFELKKEQTAIHYEMNRLVNQNQIYRVASYISSKENGIDVPREIVGLVALIWFASLSFISSITGVFLAIAGIYIQKCYDPELNKKAVV